MKQLTLGIITALAMNAPLSLPAQEAFPPVGHAPVIGKSWSFIGSFPADGDAGNAALEKEYPPEKARDFCSRYPGDGGEMVFWGGYPDPNAKKILFKKAGGKEVGGVFFAVTYIDSPSEAKTSLAFQSDVTGKLWLNGAPLGELRPGASAAFPAELKKGMNEVLVKCLVEKAGEGFSAAADDGGKGLSFTGYIPWPLAAVPASAWHVTVAAPADTGAVRTALLKKNEIGLPKSAEKGVVLAWADAAAAADGALQIRRRSPEETVFLVCHAFAPPRWRAQEYRFKLFCPKGTSLHVNGRKIDGAYDDAAQSLTCRGFADAFRLALNRVVVELPPGDGDTSVKLEMSNPGDMKYMAELLPAMDPTIHVDDWPSAEITNSIVTATVAIPDVEKGFYRGNRFEQAGIVTRLERGAHSFFLGAAAVHEPLNSHVGCGPCEEWFEAIAYDDAKPGEAFIKLGVGLYEKPFHPNHMWNHPYWPLKIFPWTTKAEKDRLEFLQEVEGPRDWSYRYVKRLILEPGKPLLLIEHSLTNTGKHRIDAEQYAHNFMALDRKPVEKGLTIAFTFPPKTVADISKIGIIDGNRLVVTADKVETKFVPLEGWAPDARDVAATITMPGVAAGIRIGGDFTVSKLGVFLSPCQISCEPFTKISLEPGATAVWTRSYEFIDDDLAGK